MNLGDDERRARLGVRHHLARRRRRSDLVAVAGDLVGLHATDPVSIFLAARARTTGLAVGDVERALYDDRTLIKTLAMRRTMFVTPTALAPLLQAASSDAVAAAERKRLAKQLETDGVAGDGTAWLDEVIPLAVAELERRGEATAAELNAAIEPMRAQLKLSPGKKYESVVNAGTRVLLLAAAEGHIVRGRPTGSWISTQYRWAPMAGWLGVAPPPPIPVAEARAELARRYLSAFGPATEADLKWWTGWGLGQTRAVLAAKAACFDTNGNIGPTIWVDGRIVGGWSHRSSGEIVTRLLEDVGREAEAAIGEEAGSLAAWLGEVRFTPRFPSPLDRELRAQLPAVEPLTDEAIRVLGCLVEKEATVPDIYPLTLNALRQACNQSSSRDPVVQYDEITIQRSLDTLKAEGWVRFVHPSHGERATKFRHAADEKLDLDDGSLAVLAVLALRGPQTSGELRTRTERHHAFGSVAEVEAVLSSLAAREEPLAVELPRIPGQHQTRWAQLLGGPVDVDALAAAPTTRANAGGLGDRMALLEAEVASLRGRISDLEAALGMEPEPVSPPPD